MTQEVNMVTPQKLFTLREVEQETGLVRSTLYRQLREGRLKGIKRGNGTWRIPRDEVDRILGVTAPE